MWIGCKIKGVSMRQLLITYVPSIVILVIMALVSTFFHVGFAVMTRDVAAIANIHPLSGILSNLGIILWCVAASICFFAAMVLRTAKHRHIGWFLFSSALLSTYLLLDDFFLFHEELARRYLGLDEKVVLATLGIAVSVYLVTFRGIILRTNFGVLLQAIGFLATSVVIDTVYDMGLLQPDNWKHFFEDGAKWLGIASWCSYYVHTSYLLLLSAFGLPNGTIQSDTLTLHRR